MTARSSVNLSKFGSYFGYKLRGLSPLITLTSIFAFLSYPAAFFCMTMAAICSEKYDAITSELVSKAGYASLDLALNSETFQWDYLLSSPEYVAAKEQFDMWNGIQSVMVFVMFLALASIFMMGFIVIMRNFRYCFQKRYVDMDFSLPISEQTRFLGDFLSGLTACLIPHLAAVGIGIGFYANAMAQDFSFFKETGIAEIPVVQYMFIGVFACIMFYCLTLLVVVCCGRTTEAGTAPIIINAAIPIIMYTARHLSLLNCPNDVCDDRIFALPFTVTSPAGMLITAVFNAEITDTPFGGTQYTVLTASELCCAIIFTLAYAVGAAAISLRRRNERVGEPYVIKPMRHIVSGGLTLSIVSLFSAFCLFEDFDFATEKLPYIITMLIITFVAFVIMELISGKGFKKFPKTLARYIAVMGGSLLLCGLVTFTKGFGVNKYVPAGFQVKYASVEITCRTDNWRTMMALDKMYITDSAQLDKLTDINSQAIKDDTQSDIRLSVKYLLKSGNYVSRNLNISPQQAEELLRGYIGSEDWNNSYSILDKPLKSVSLYGDYISAELTDTEAFRQALKSDMAAATYDSIFNTDALDPCAFIWAITEDESVQQYLSLYPGFENTYAILYETGCLQKNTVPSADDTVILAKVAASSYVRLDSGWMTEIFSYDTLGSLLVGGFDYDKDHQFTSEDIEKFGWTSEEYANIFTDEGGVVIDPQSADYSELSEYFSTSVMSYDDTEYFYVLCTIHDTYPLGGSTYLIRPEGLDKAAAIFDKLAAEQAA